MYPNKISIKIYPALLFLILILLGLTGCGSREAAAVETPIEEPGPNATGSPGVGIEPAPGPEGLTYTDNVYGFKFDYPVTWTLTEEDHSVTLVKGCNQLGISFRWVDEQVDPYFGRTGMGAGDLIYADKISFMDQVIPAEVLIYEGKSKAVFYGETGLVDLGDRVFMIVLEDLETGYLDVDLADETILEARSILESFRPLETATGAGETSEDTGLQAYLNIQDSIQIGSGEPVKLHILLKNHSQVPLYLLKWYTPFEGVAGDIFIVTRDGQALPYLGILASRGNPTPEAYILLEPGESKYTAINIGTAYDFSQPGTYTIKFRSPRISHIARSEAEMASTLDELVPVYIPSNEVLVKIVEGPQE